MHNTDGAPKRIKIHGARVHNLKNINVEIPLNQIVGIAGVSGSGKSSLALGVVYAEGSRRYLESLSTYTRRRMTGAAKAQVDEILYVPAALALHQRPGVPGIRSTFGTGTELLNSLRLMYSRLASHRCPSGHYVAPTLAVAAEQPIYCPICKARVLPPSAEQLAFNSQGACPECSGTGLVRRVDMDALVPDEYKKFVYAGHAGATGDAIKMVEGLDADLINMDLVNTQPNSMILPSGLGQYCNPGVAGAYKAGAYMVNQNGERFFNESANAWDLMQAMKQNEAQYLIMDQTAFDNFNAGMTNSKIYTMEDVEKWLSDDYDGQPVMKQGATLAELCEKLNLPADAVEASAKAFNDCAAAQTADAFGRTPAAAQSEEGPFYALQMHIRYYASLGGLHINDNMQVLNTKQEAIPGLYAAGEVVGGLEGDVYMGATLFGWAIASGYDAANAVNAVIAQ